MKLTLGGAKTIISLNLEEARETAKYDHRTSEYWPTLIGERLWFLNMLNNIEAESVKHGRWIKNEGRSGWHCSCCGKDDLYVYPYTENNERELQDFYCPNCGAKMDSEENERFNKQTGSD